MQSTLTKPKMLWDALDKCPIEDFPSSSDYPSRFKALADYLDRLVHPAVTVAASLKDGGLLTDHGTEHVRTVIRRASELINNASGFELSCYETYLLLASIHIHDIGNMSGRDGHELGSAEIVQRLGAVFGPDYVEKLMIFKIAQAHGGRIGQDKDKIAKLQEVDHLLGMKVRPRALAALLRFSDELADDRTRAARFLLDNNKVPKSSEIFHKYAFALHSVVISGNAIKLDFEISKADAQKVFGKYKKSVYLLDEIFERVTKMHYERIYCMRFLRPMISIDIVDVSINIYGENFINDPIATIDFRMEEAGYPSCGKDAIFNICPPLAEHECGAPLCGESLKTYLGDK